jgi:hypothetical protein
VNHNGGNGDGDACETERQHAARILRVSVAGSTNPADCDLDWCGDRDGRALNREKLPPGHMEDARHREHWSSGTRNEASENQNDYAALFHRVLRFKKPPRTHESQKPFAVHQARTEVSANPDPTGVTQDETEIGSDDRRRPIHVAVVDGHASWDEQKVF